MQAKPPPARSTRAGMSRVPSEEVPLESTATESPTSPSAQGDAENRPGDEHAATAPGRLHKLAIFVQQSKAHGHAVCRFVRDNWIALVCVMCAFLIGLWIATPRTQPPQPTNPFFLRRSAFNRHETTLPAPWCAALPQLEDLLETHLAEGVGDARMYRMLARAMCGHNVTVVAVGGSMTFGSFIPGDVWRYVHWVGEYLWKRFPSVPLVRAYTHGIPASASDIMSLCYENKLGIGGETAQAHADQLQMQLPDGETGGFDYPSILHHPAPHFSHNDSRHAFQALPVPIHDGESHPVPDLVLIEYARNDGYVANGVGETNLVDGDPNTFRLQDYSKEYLEGFRMDNVTQAEAAAAADASAASPPLPRFIPWINMERLVRAILWHATSAPMLVNVMQNEGCSFSAYYRDVAAYYSVLSVELTDHLRHTLAADLGFDRYIELAQSAYEHFTPVGHRIQARFIEQKIEAHLATMMGWLDLLSQTTDVLPPQSRRPPEPKQSISPSVIKNVHSCGRKIEVAITNPRRADRVRPSRDAGSSVVLPSPIYAANTLASRFSCSTCWALPQCIDMLDGMNPLGDHTGWEFTPEPTALGNFPLNKIGWTATQPDCTIRLALPTTVGRMVIVSVLFGWSPDMGIAEMQVETERESQVVHLSDALRIDAHQGNHTALKLIPMPITAAAGQQPVWLRVTTLPRISPRGSTLSKFKIAGVFVEQPGEP